MKQILGAIDMFFKNHEENISSIGTIAVAERALWGSAILL